MVRKFYIAILTTLSLVCCSKPMTIESSRKIGFASQVSRSLISSVEELRQTDIAIYGSYTLDGGTARVFDAERLYYDGEIGAWDYLIPQYWISNAQYRFCAISPYSTNSLCSYSDETGSTTIANYSSYSGGADLLYATAERDLVGNADFSTVSLHFRHACACVQFNIVNASSQKITDIRNIRLVGLHNRGDFRFDTTGAASWSLDDTVVDATSEEQPFGGICTLPSGGLEVNLGVKYPLDDDKTLILLPQSIYKSGVTLQLEYIKQGDMTYAVRNIALGMLGGNTPTEWKAGEKYEYNLTVTNNTITADVIVVDWVDNFVDL